MAKITGNKYEKKQVHVDGNEFINCEFIDSTIIFSANAPTSLSGCRFHNSIWKFEGPASLTLGFLTAMYHGAGEGGKVLVEATFDKIRKIPAN